MASWRPPLPASRGLLLPCRGSLWHLEQPGAAVRTVPGVVSLSGHGAVEFPDPGGIAGGHVHLDGLIRELESQGLQNTFDQIQALPVVGQLYPVEQMVAVARVAHNRLGPPEPPQELSDLHGPSAGGL